MAQAFGIPHVGEQLDKQKLHASTDQNAAEANCWLLLYFYARTILVLIGSAITPESLYKNTLSHYWG